MPIDSNQAKVAKRGVPACFETGWPASKRAGGCKSGRDVYTHWYICMCYMKFVYCLCLFNCIDNYAPQDFVCTAVSSTAINCTWSPPHLSDYLVLWYEITHKLADGFDYYPTYGEIISSQNLTSETNEISISSLQPYGGYVVELRASSAPAPISTTSGSGEIPREPDSSLLPDIPMVLSGDSTAVTTLSEGELYILHM